jgi:hypothetical protein|uniref:Uncharacterized protein n=1 Tax=viral metagenome TaxID=1070528 RepID=A0A6C0M2Y0_9ZZZZ
MSGSKNGGRVTMAGEFFHSLSIGQRLGVEKFEGVLPVVRVPFIRDEATFKYFNYRGKKANKSRKSRKSSSMMSEASFIYKPKSRLLLREELVAGIRNPNPLERPIVFLVTTNIPHTGIYILYGGQFYSVAFGYDTTPSIGSLYSIDIPLVLFSEARIIWIGILTDDIMIRLQGEFDLVTRIVGNFETDRLSDRLVERLMFFHTPRVYGGLAADTDPTQWNCSKWAMYVLFGGVPANFRQLVGKSNPGLTEDQLKLWLAAYKGEDPHEFIRVLNQINHADSPRAVMGGGRRMMNNRTRMKRKPIKMRRTTRKPQ